MTDGTHRVSSPTGEYTLILPGTWASIPMDDADRLQRRVAAVVKQQVPKGDRLARMRQTARQELMSSATRASELGASVYALSLEILPGIPFAASLIAYNEAWPPGATREGTVEERLLATLPGGEVVASDSSAVLRRSDYARKLLGSTEIWALDLEYWFVTPADRLLCFLISVPMCESAELFTAFFDAVADSVRWTSPQSPMHSSDVVAAAPGGSKL